MVVWAVGVELAAGVLAAGFFSAFSAFTAFLAAGFFTALAVSAVVLAAAFLAAGFLAAGCGAAASGAAGFSAAAFLAGAFLAGASLMAGFGAVTFSATTFGAAAFLAGALAGAFAATFTAVFAAVFAAVFLAAGFGAAAVSAGATDAGAAVTFFAGAFAGAAFFAAGFFAVAMVFSSIRLQKALRLGCSGRSDSQHWAFGSPGSMPRTQEQRSLRTLGCGHGALRISKSLLCGLCAFCQSCAVNPRRGRRQTGIQSHGFQRSCVLFSGRSSRSSTGTGFPRSGTASLTRSAWRGDWRCSASSL